MINRNLIVDKESPTPIDNYRFNSLGEMNIYYAKGLDRNFTLQIKDSNGLDSTMKDVTNNLTTLWQLIEQIRVTAYNNRMVVNVRDMDARTSYNRITLATTLDKVEKAEALDRQMKRIKATRRRMLVENKYHSRKRKKLTPRVLRPILREEKTW